MVLPMLREATPLCAAYGYGPDFIVLGFKISHIAHDMSLDSICTYSVGTAAAIQKVHQTFEYFNDPVLEEWTINYEVPIALTKHQLICLNNEVVCEMAGFLGYGVPEDSKYRHRGFTMSLIFKHKKSSVPEFWDIWNYRYNDRADGQRIRSILKCTRSLPVPLITSHP